MALFLPLMLALACGGSATFSKDQARDSLPNKDSVAMNTPAGSSAGLKNGLSAATVSDDFYFGLTASVAGTFNGSVAIFLNLIASVTANEPTSCTPTSCTWGPGSGALEFNNYQLTVSLNDDGSYHWVLSGQPKSRASASFTTIVSGDATPSGTAHHGSGSFSMDFDAAATLDGPHDATGKLDVTHYSNVGPAQLAVTYTGAKDGTVQTQIDNIAYSYEENATGGGTLQFAVHNTSTGDRISVESRWKNDGSGRADLKGPTGSNLTVSDCWGPAPFIKVFFTSTVTLGSYPFAGAGFGLESACAFSPAVFSSLTVQ